MRHSKHKIFLLLAIVFVAGCALKSSKSRTLHHFGSRFLSLESSSRDTIKLKRARRKGNFGFGILADNSASFILNGGNALVINESGNSDKAPYRTKLSSALVTSFYSKRQLETITPRNYSELTQYIEKKLDKSTEHHALRITGKFRSLKLSNSLNKSKVDEVQKNLSGTLIGFRLPSKTKTGVHARYPLFFISRNKRFGGLVINLTVEESSIELSPISRLEKLK